MEKEKEEIKLEKGEIEKRMNEKEDNLKKKEEEVEKFMKMNSELKQYEKGLEEEMVKVHKNKVLSSS